MIFLKQQTKWFLEDRDIAVTDWIDSTSTKTQVE
ncbi:hypothetical protein F383_06007 [Gossypium arboreum]|uniref:Uncharacterized protein n=1 Tax=Gossypium arboreum TaxID=29729 RepID=A0A0B0P251_GOSAR|nr:hypothetical protein F383_06007 [Gossypium arboreum]